MLNTDIYAVGILCCDQSECVWMTNRAVPVYQPMLALTPIPPEPSEWVLSPSSSYTHSVTSLGSHCPVPVSKHPPTKLTLSSEHDVIFCWDIFYPQKLAAPVPADFIHNLDQSSIRSSVDAGNYIPNCSTMSAHKMGLQTEFLCNGKFIHDFIIKIHILFSWSFVINFTQKSLD